MSINLTEKAASEVKRLIAEQSRPPVQGAANGESGSPAFPDSKIYLRLRVVGGGCSGFQHKLDLDAKVNQKLDEIWEEHGVPLAVDKRSLMYCDGVTIDFHDEINRRGFSIQNPNAKTTCGCGSSFSM